MAFSQKLFPVERQLLAPPNYTTKCPWTPPEPGMNQQIDAVVQRILPQLDDAYDYVPVQLYATVKVEVASGCGGVAVLPSWRHRATVSVTVPVGSQVELHAQPCTACSLLRWEVSDGVSAWNATGYFLGLVVWLVSTLNSTSLLRGVCGGFLLRLARKEGPVYLYADLRVLAGRADVPRSFLARELAAYSVLAGYVARCSIDTGVNGPLDVARGVLGCLSRSR